MSTSICHVGHQGIERTKRLLRTKVFFFSMDRMVEDTIRNCISCQCTGPAKPPPPVQKFQTTCETLYIWTTLVQYQYLTNTCWSPLSRNSVREQHICKTDHQRLNKTFATYGNHLKIVTDNGPPFTSKELRTFMEESDIDHHRITPIWPQANGQVESFIKPLMKTIRAAYIEGKDMRQNATNFSINTFLHRIPWQKYPQRIWCLDAPQNIPHIPPHNDNDELKHRDRKAKEKAASFANIKRHAKIRTVCIEDQVLVKQRAKNKLSPSFVAVPYRVIAIKGSMITVKDINSDRILTRIFPILSLFLILQSCLDFREGRHVRWWGRRYSGTKQSAAETLSETQ